MLAGVSTNASPALAACPLPPGVTPPDNPGVTAQQVVDGSASLEEFAVAARDFYRSESRGQATLERAAYLGCLTRQDDGVWRSGSTYIVSLTPDGRVFIHAKDMALSGRLLNPVIYGAILSGLGVSQADLANMASPDPATAARAFGAVMGVLMQEPAGAFDATTPIPNLSPGIPGASGHAGVYFSLNFKSPIVILAGFDLNETHLAEEDIDYGDPSVTAEDVVDRETLEGLRYGSDDPLSRSLRNWRYNRYLEGQDSVSGSGRALEARFGVPLHPGSHQQHNYPSRRVSEQIRAPTSGSDRPGRRERTSRSAAGHRCGGQQPGRRLRGVLL